MSAEELQLRKRARRRLVGAIALVLVTVIVLPRVLEHQPRSVRQQIEIQLRSPAAPDDAIAPSDAAAGNGAGKGAGAPGEASTSIQSAPGYVIQIGAFQDAEKARAIEARIKASGHPAFTAVVNTPQGARVRVRAGPFATQEAAIRTREQLKRLALMPRSSEGRIVTSGD